MTEPARPRADLRLDGMGAMVYRNLQVYRKTWKVNALPPLAEPLLYLLAFGYGLGVLIDQVAGVPYRTFIAPAIITITMMQTAFFETTYSSYVRMVFQKTWDAVLATPLSADDVLWGEVLWSAVRATINAALMTVVVAAFGLLQWPTALLIVPLAFLVGMVFGGLGLLITAKVPGIDQFSYAFFLFITPQFLFSGTFFPIAQLPGPVQAAAYALPLTHCVALVRAVALDRFTGIEAWSLLYVVVAAVVIPWIAVREAKKKVVK